jgi:arginyl-tRNA synthetase
VITLDLRHAIARVVAEAGYGDGAHSVDPGLRPGGRPGEYASSVAFALTRAGSASGAAPAAVARELAARLDARYDWIAEARATGQGYITISVTSQVLVNLPGRLAAAGPDCVRSDALAGRVFPALEFTPGNWESAPTWTEARARLAAELTSRLAAAAGATMTAEGTAAAEAAAGATMTAGEAAAVGDEMQGGAGEETENSRERRDGEMGSEVAAAVAFAGTDAVLFSLASVTPGRSVTIGPWNIARHHPDNPAYAVRYAHARAASGVRWAAALGTGEAGPQRPPADPEELPLLDALSWLPERVAIAARRGRPDEFARFAHQVAELTLATVTIPTSGRAPGSDRLAIAEAARTGLAASLGVLGVSAPDRL